MGGCSSDMQGGSVQPLQAAQAMFDLQYPLMFSIQEKQPSFAKTSGRTAVADEEVFKLMRSRYKLLQTTTSLESRLHRWLSYFHSLSNIEPRYAISLERSHLEAIYFTWQDSFRPSEKHSHTSIRSEMVAVVFNVGAVYSQIAVAENWGTDDGLKEAYKAFRKAAGAFVYLRERFGEGESVDVLRECVSMLEMLMVAQAQECLFHRTVKKKPKIRSMSARRVGLCYEEVFGALRTEALKRHFPKGWFANVQLKASQFYAESCYHYSLYLHESEEDKIGEEIARLEMGIERLTSTKNVISELHERLNSRLEKAKKENNSIYNMRVPAPGSLPDLPTHNPESPKPLKDLVRLAS